jgi:hypothetical protein
VAKVWKSVAMIPTARTADEPPGHAAAAVKR